MSQMLLRLKSNSETKGHCHECTMAKQCSIDVFMNVHIPSLKQLNDILAKGLVYCYEHM